MYRDPDLKHLIDAMTWAMREVVDAEALEDRAKNAATEAERKAGEARCRLSEAVDAYRAARWP